jgi:hypothetical protein
MTRLTNMTAAQGTGQETPAEEASSRRQATEA